MTTDADMTPEELTAEIVKRAETCGRKPDKKSPLFGRYRLHGDQVCPNYRPCYDVYLKLRPDAEEEVRRLADDLPHLVPKLFFVYDDSHFQNRMYSTEYPFQPSDRLLVFCMISDVCYIAEENIYAGFKLFSEYMEDGHFFVYSTGDGDDRWIHEYKTRDGVLTIGDLLAA